MTALLIAEHDNVTLKPATAQALTAALRMTDREFAGTVEGFPPNFPAHKFHACY